jgi:asparagine synthase (glutamine-hydrolysing)
VCGIAGVVARDNELVNVADLHRMCEAIVHRGPDDEGIYAKGSVGMGMRRLSIIDLSGGRQPISSENGSVWVVFNGEIYNFSELRRELESRGHRFSTHTDTEVIVHLYEDMGADCVKKLRGMFAIALYDVKRRSLLLARDRLGKKPLHYAFKEGRLWFASEIKSLLAVAPDLAALDAQGLLQFFYFGYIPDPRTAFAAIQKLPPGHLLEFRNGYAHVRTYWDLPTYGSHDPKSEEECLNELEQRLDEAVRMRLISDVPLGALLSGGVDSSVVVGLMARNSSRPIKTFSVAFPRQEFNEAQHARAVAEHFSTDHHEFMVEPDIESTLSYLTGIMDEPFGDSSMVPTYHVCRLARQHVAVALSGDGGDELFAGYDRYQVHLDRQKFGEVPAWAGRGFREWIYPWLPAAARGRRLAFHLSLNSRDRFIDSISFLPVLDREPGLLSQEFLSWAGEDPRPTQIYQNYFDGAPASDTLGRLLYMDTKTYLPADILTKVDRMSMATSLEARCPILDHVFVEWATSLSSAWKMRGGVRKYILRKLAQRLGIPASVLDRPKQGFAMPLSHWWRGELKDNLLQILLEPQTIQRGYFDPQAVRSLLNEHLSGRRNRPTDVWLLLMFELWHRNFLHVSGGMRRANLYAEKDLSGLSLQTEVSEQSNDSAIVD